MAKRRILLCCFSLGGGGAERTLLNLAQSFDREDVRVVSFTGERAYALEGVAHDVLGIDPLASRGWRPRSRAMLELIRRLNAERRVFSPDVCVSFGFWPNVLNVLTSGHGRTILSVRSNPASMFSQDRASALPMTLVRVLYPLADHTVAISEGVRGTLIERFGLHPDRVTTIYNPARLEVLERQAALGLPDAARVQLGQGEWLLAVGRMVQAKGQWHLVRVFARLAQQRPGLKLVILGEGALRAELEGLVSGLGLRCSRDFDADADVFLPGFVANPYAFMSRATVFAFPSLWEGLGNSLVEAMSLGAFACAADCDFGPRELLDPGSPARASAPGRTGLGVLLPVMDGAHHGADAPLVPAEQAWVEGLDEALSMTSSQRREVGERARARVWGAFSAEAIVSHWRAVLFESPGKSP